MKHLPFRPSAGSGSLPSSNSPPENARTISYVRVSTEDQAAEDRASLGEQVRQCAALAAERGRTVDFVWSDAGVSGRDEARLERLTTWCEAHRRPKTDRGLVVVLKRDRWARFVHDDNASAFYEYRLTRANWDVEFVLERKTGNRTGDAVLATIHRRLASEESEERSRRAQMGMIAQAKAGHWLGRPPFGYDREAISENGKRRRLMPGERSADGERVRLVLGDPRAVRAVQRIFEWYAEGVGVEEIAKRLNKERAPSPASRYPNVGRARGTPSPAQWTPWGAVSKILRCEAYIGRRRFRPRILDEGEKGPTTHRDSWIVVDNAHEALIDQQLLDRVQARLTRPHRPRGATPTRYLLLGILRCRCGAEFIGSGGTRYFVLSRTAATHVQVGPKRSTVFRPAKPGERAMYRKVEDPESNSCYRCPQCREPRIVTINRRWLEARVIDEVSKHVQCALKDGSFDRVLDDLLESQGGKRRKVRRDVEAERSQVKQEQARLVEAVAKGLLQDYEVKDLRDALRKRLDDLEAEGQRDKFAERGATLDARARVKLKQMARDFAARIAKADIATARELLALWVSEIVVDGRDPAKRTGRLILRRVPLPQLADQPQAVRSAGRYGRRRQQSPVRASRFPGRRRR
jgi:DNA invertase Pin-like site-specific DNA recombinase